MSLWRELLANLVVVAIATSIWTGSHHHLAAFGNRQRTVALGLVMAMGALVVMELPFQFRPGILLDTRYTFIAISSFFGGPLAALITGGAAMLRRLMIGGTGLTVAIPNIAAATAFGLIGYRLTRHRIASFRALIALSLSVSVSGTAGFYFALPQEIWRSLTVDIVVPFGLILFVATLLAGFAVTQELKRHAVTTANNMYRAVIEALPDCLNAKDLDGRFVVANPATAYLMGAKDPNALYGKTDRDFYPPETASAFRLDEVEVMHSGSTARMKQTFLRGDGRQTWLSTLKAPLYDENNKLIGLITHNKEITEQRQLELALADAQGRLEDAVASMADGLAMFDGDGKLIFQNQQHRDLFPVTADLRTPGACLTEIVKASLERGEEKSFGEEQETVEQRVARLLQPGDRTVQLQDGRWIKTRTRPAAGGGTTMVFSDISVHRNREIEMEMLNQRLGALAATDSLTGLLNRRAFDKALDLAVDRANLEGSDIGLLMIDVDHFKNFNDTYGHPAGDDCLKKVSEALQTVLKGTADMTLARYGGEEIAIILPRAGLAEARAIGHLVCSAIRQLDIAHIGSEKKFVTASAGVATLRGLATMSTRDLVRRADEALYRAKASGRGCVRDLSGIDAA